MPLNEKSALPSLMRAIVKSTAWSFAPARQPVDDGAARIAEPEQLGHLVERLARRVVARAAEQPVAAARRAPRTGWCGRRRPPARARAAGSRRARGRAPRCGRRCGGRAPAACVDEGDALRDLHADQQRAHQPRALRHRHRVELRSSRAPPRPSPSRPRARCSRCDGARPARAPRRRRARGSRPGSRRRSRGCGGRPRPPPPPSRRRRSRSRGGGRSSGGDGLRQRAQALS